MQVALICPPSLLKKYGILTRYHLTLPHLVHQQRYKDFYQERSRLGDFVILDNGAAEHVEFGARHLHTLARDMEVDEIVAHDVLADCDATIERVGKFASHVDSDFKYMAVAQGKSEADVIRAIHEYLKMGWISTIGIPKLICHYDKPAARVSIGEYIAKKELHKQVAFHALGASKWKEEVRDLAELDVYRGIDTAMPLVYAFAGKTLNTPDYVERQQNFFELTGANPLMQSNCFTYLMRAQYDRTELVAKKESYVGYA